MPQSSSFRPPDDFDRLGDLLGEVCAPEVAAPEGLGPGNPTVDRATPEVSAPGGPEAAGPAAAGRAGPPALAARFGRMRGDRRGGWQAGPEDLERRLAGIWQETVGAEIAANARPAQLRGGRLVATTSSSAWAQTLHLMSDMIRARLNEKLGEGAVDQVVFRHAGWEEPLQVSVADQRGAAQSHARGTSSVPAVPGPPPGERTDPLTPEQQEALAALGSLDLAPDLRETIERAMRASFRVRGEQDSVR